MPVAFVTIKLPDGGLVHLDVELRTRVDEFRSILAPKCGVKRHRQRLVFAGRLLQDGRTLEAYGIERNSTIHLLHGGSTEGEGPGGVDISQIPSQLGALQRHVLANPDILQQMLESPAMQSLLNDHDFLRSLLKMDPRLTKLLENSPQMSGMLMDGEFMKQCSEAMRNPVHVRDVLRSTDRAAVQLEALGGGAFDVLRQMCEDIRRPDADPGRAEVKKKKKKAKPKPIPDEAEAGEEAAAAEGEGGEEGEGEAEVEAADEAADEAPDKPVWVGTFDTNAMASMMQDQNMQHLLSQLAQTINGPTAKLHPDDPFIDSGFIGQMFHAQTVNSMNLLQQAVEKLSMAAETAEKKGKKKKDEGEPLPAADSPAVLSGLHPKSPAADFKNSFSLYLQAEAESPEVRYKGQLQAMANMGFADKEACIQALHACDGNMNRAVESLMSQQGK